MGFLDTYLYNICNMLFAYHTYNIDISIFVCSKVCSYVCWHLQAPLLSRSAYYFYNCMRTYFLSNKSFLPYTYTNYTLAVYGWIKASNSGFIRNKLPSRISESINMILEYDAWFWKYWKISPKVAPTPKKQLIYFLNANNSTT